MDKNFFSYHLTKYFAEYLPKQTAASPNTIRSYRDTFVQLMEFYKTEYRLLPKSWNTKNSMPNGLKAFLSIWKKSAKSVSAHETSVWQQSMLSSDTSSTVTLPDLNSVRRYLLFRLRNLLLNR